MNEKFCEVNVVSLHLCCHVIIIVGIVIISNAVVRTSVAVSSTSTAVVVLSKIMLDLKYLFRRIWYSFDYYNHTKHNKNKESPVTNQCYVFSTRLTIIYDIT